MIDSSQEARPFATPRVAAGALFVDDQNRVLLVRPTYKEHWDIPGGYVEAGESPLLACIREVQEELGLTVPISRFLTVDWAPRLGEGDKLLFIFDGGALRPEQVDAISFADGEIAEWRFVDCAQLDDLTIPRLADRIRSTLAARIANTSAYLERGVEPSA